jgi:hypothetical protein
VMILEFCVLVMSVSPMLDIYSLVILISCVNVTIISRYNLATLPP